MSRRIKGTGTLYWDNNRKKWIFRVTYKTLNGAKRTKWLSAETKTKLKKSMEDLRKSMQEKTFAGSQILLKDWIREWLSSIIKDTVKKSTASWYEDMTNHIIDSLGPSPIDTITPVILQREFQRLLKEGGKEKQGLSAVTVNSVRTVLREAFGAAVENEIINKNPVKSTKPIRYEKKEIVIMDEAQVKNFLETVRKGKYIYEGIKNKNYLNEDKGTEYYKTQFFVLVSLDLATGMRISEIKTLNWDDINLVKKYLWVKNQLKTKNSRRKIYLNNEIIKELQAFKLKQLIYSRSLGDQFQNTKNRVFTNTIGGEISVSNFRKRYFNKMLKAAGAPEGFTIHSMRHTHATLLLKNGVNIKVISERLGHASIEFTLATYAHVLDSMQSEAANTWNRIIKK